MTMVPFEVQFSWIWQPGENPKAKGISLCETPPHNLLQNPPDATPDGDDERKDTRMNKMTPRNCITIFLGIAEISAYITGMDTSGSWPKKKSRKYQ